MTTAWLTEMARETLERSSHLRPGDNLVSDNQDETAECPDSEGAQGVIDAPRTDNDLRRQDHGGEQEPTSDPRGTLIGRHASTVIPQQTSAGVRHDLVR